MPTEEVLEILTWTSFIFVTNLLVERTNKFYIHFNLSLNNAVFSVVAICVEAMFRICGVVHNLKLAMFVIKPIMSLNVAVIVPFFVPELPVVPASK